MTIVLPFLPNMSSIKTVTKVDQSMAANRGLTCSEEHTLADLLGQKHRLGEANIKRRTRVRALSHKPFLLVVFLAISNMASLIVAACITNNTLVDPALGALTIQGSDDRLSAVAAGVEHLFTWPKDDKEGACIDFLEEFLGHSHMGRTPP
jgi:hypothetical protein